MKKIIFFDVDGTIISDETIPGERTIPDSLNPTLNALRKNGHLCFINTGRAFAEIDDMIRALPFDGYVCGCGTSIYYNNDLLFQKTFPASSSQKLIKDLDEHNLEWLLEGKDYVYYSTNKYSTMLGIFQNEHKRLLKDKFKLVDPAKADNLIFNKFCICTKENHDFYGFSKMYSEVLDFIDRGSGFYEAIPQGCSKASGIAFLEKFFDISHENTIAIGDSSNDLPMLNYVSYSIAMGNGKKELFDVVDYVTDTVENDGIKKAMSHLKLI